LNSVLFKMSDAASASPAEQESQILEPLSDSQPAESLEVDQAATANLETTASTQAPTVLAAAGTWQAIWSPPHNAYYFYNSTTQQTTWTNPLQSDTTASASGSSTASATRPDNDGASTHPEAGPSTATDSSHAALRTAAEAAGIDPALAYLDPSLASSIPGAHSAGFKYTAKFNARTGAFAKPDARDPTHMSEYERAKRMSEFYFDVGAWEKDVEERKKEEAEEAEGSGKKRKRPTKKDLVSRFSSTRLVEATTDTLRALLGALQRTEKTEKNSQDGVAADLTGHAHDGYLGSS
jgi:hypothetical protein